MYQPPMPTRNCISNEHFTFTVPVGLQVYNNFYDFKNSKFANTLLKCINYSILIKIREPTVSYTTCMLQLHFSKVCFTFTISLWVHKSIVTFTCEHLKIIITSLKCVNYHIPIKM